LQPAARPQLFARFLSGYPKIKGYAPFAPAGVVWLQEAGMRAGTVLLLVA
jgi:hypothetical protein